LHGLNPSKLNVFLKQNEQLGLPVWSKSRSQGKGWLRGEFRISKLNYPMFQIVLEADIVDSSFGVQKFLTT
jgi:hypothetical protein